MHHRYARQNIPIELLRTLVTLDDLKSFTKAATVLELSQPAISAQMKRLQSLLAIDILDRRTPGFMLTSAGQATVGYARKLLALNDQILDLARAGEREHTLRVGASSAFVDPIIGIRETLSRRLGVASMKIVSDTSRNLARDLDRGFLDVAILLTETPGAARRSWSERLIWAQASDFVVPHGKPLPLVSRPETLCDAVAMKALDGAGIAYTIPFVTQSMATLVRAVAGGIGVAVLPERMLGPSLKVTRCDRLPALPAAFGGLYWRDSLAWTVSEEAADDILSELAPSQRREAGRPKRSGP